MSGVGEPFSGNGRSSYWGGVGCGGGLVMETRGEQEVPVNSDCPPASGSQSPGRGPAVHCAQAAWAL